LIEPVINTSFDGPQLDDLLAIQRLYGDVFEEGSGNDAFGVATPLGPLSPAQSIARGTLGSSTVIASTQTDFLSIDDDTDTDFFSFSIGSRLDVRLQLTPRGTSYSVGPEDGSQSTLNTLSLSNLSLALFDTNGTSLLATADANAAGLGEEILRQLLPGTYYARVKGAQNDIQLYGLNLTSTVPLPRNLVWVGNISANWIAGSTANFREGAAATIFYDLDNATFDDTSSVKTVNLPANISAGNVRVTTATSYRFTGAGIVAGNLTIDGTGSVELANSGNSYAGSTQVSFGTLRITGNANAMVSPITIANGATLVMEATDAATMASTFTIQPGGVLQIGTITSSTNVFPDAPSAITNNGTIRVFDDELLRSVSGAGQIVIERETVSLQSNSGFQGAVVVKSAAVGKVEDSAALGSTAGSTAVENGGSLLVDTNANIADAVSIAGDGMGTGAIRVATSRSPHLFGAVSIPASTATIQLDSNSTAAFHAALNGAANNARLVLRTNQNANMTALSTVNLGSGGITKQGLGLVELSGAVSYTGPTIVEQGVLLLHGTGTHAGEFEVAQGATIEVGGTHQFAASSSFTGNGQFAGDILMPGTIAPGSSAGSLTFSDNLTLTASSRLDLEIGGTAAVDYDHLAITGAAELDGLLEITLLGSFDPILGNTFEVLRADNGIFGEFNDFMLPELSSVLAWNIIYSEFAVLLEIVPPVEDLTGDYNRNGVVDAADYAVWQKTNGQSGPDLAADGNGDDVIDTEDYEVWATHFDELLGGSAGVQITRALSSAADVAAPEPAALVLLLAAGIMVFAAKRR
jgi:autotransporter-associated beta strand protein